MADIVSSTIKNVLIALYQPFWFALLLSVLFMFFLMYAKEKHDSLITGIKSLVKDWLLRFKNEKMFRRLSLLVFYTSLVLFKTLLSRAMHINPVTNVIGVWGLYKQSNGEMIFTTEVIENIVLFVPFTFLYLLAFREKITEASVPFFFTIWVLNIMVRRSRQSGVARFFRNYPY